MKKIFILLIFLLSTCGYSDLIIPEDLQLEGSYIGVTSQPDLIYLASNTIIASGHLHIASGLNIASNVLCGFSTRPQIASDDDVIIAAYSASSGDITVGSQYIGIRHDQASGRLVVASGNLVVTADGGYVEFADSTITTPDDKGWDIGGGKDVQIEWDTGQTNDAMLWGISGSKYIIICEKEDMGTDFQVANSAYPLFLVHSGDVAQLTDMVGMYHDQEDGNFRCYKGDINMIGGTAGRFRCAAPGKRIEFTDYVDNPTFLAISGVDSWNYAHIALTPDYGMHIELTTYANIDIDGDHENQTNPTFYWQSATSANVSNNQWGAWCHDQENFLCTAGANVGTGTGATTDNNGVLFQLSELTSGGTANFGLSLTRTLNDSGAAGGSDLFNGFLMNITTTDTTGWDTVNLMDLQEDSTSRFLVDIDGNATLVGDIAVNGDDITCDGELSITPAGGYLIIKEANLHVNDGNPIRLYSSDEAEYGQLQMGDQDFTISTGGTNDRDILIQPASNVRINKPVYTGDGGTTNYATFAADGELTLVGTARVKKTEWVNAETFKVPSTNPASLIDYGISATLEFSDEAVNYENARPRIKVPKDIDTTVQPILILGWSCPTADPGDDSIQVRWEVSYLWRTDNEAMDGAAEATVTDNYTTSETSKGLVITEVQLANLGATDKCLLVNVARRSDNAGDTADGVAVNLSGACLYYTKNKLGEAL